MKIGLALVLLTVFLSETASAQVERQDVFPMRSEVQPMLFEQPLLTDSSRISTLVLFPKLQTVLPPTYDHTSNFTQPMTTTPKLLWLWNSANIIVDGSNYQILGLMDEATGAVSFHQDFGRLHLTASAVANKYWMPMQSHLHTQYGFGGTIGYKLTDAVSLHAFGYYYANNPLVGPASSPYVSTTSFGGYANIRFSENFGSEVGVRRYVNPMSGRWTTSPIVTPYFRVGKRHKVEIGLPLGELLKAAIWGDNDKPPRYRPQPPQPQPKKK